MKQADFSEQVLEDSVARVRVRWLAPNAVRITHAEAGSREFPADRPWLKDVLILPVNELDPSEGLQVWLAEGSVQVQTRQDEVLLQQHGAVKCKRKGGFELGFHIQSGESFYGWGEWFNAFQRKHGRLRLKTLDALSPLQGRHTYSTIPFYLSSRGFGLFLLNSHTCRWEINPQKGLLAVKADGAPLDYIVIHGPAFKDILSTYTSLTGRPALLPKWAFGLWVTSYPQGDQAGVLKHVQEHRQRQIPLDAVILDYHWEERFHNFKWRRTLIPDPDGMIASLRAEGMRLGLIFTPFLNRRSQPLKKIGLQLLAKDIPRGMLFTDESALAEYREALGKGYLAHPNTAWWFGKGGMFDFSRPDAAAWWNEKMKPLYVQGVDFFKNDDGEYLPEDASSALGMEGREYHNLYGFFYGKAIYEGMQALDGRRGLVYARSVWAGSQRYPGAFLGDQKPTFECLKRTLRAGLNLGLAGFAYWTADAFGLDGKTTEETHMRYAQWALLNPIARYFWRPPEVDDTRFPWSHGPRSEQNFRLYAGLRYRLLPYYYTLGWQAWESGVPILRPMLLEYQSDGRFADVYDQVMLGDALLLAPVVEQGARSRHILLPQGVWYDFWSTQRWEGPAEIEYAAPLERLPLFARGGAVLPMGPVMQHIPDLHRFEELTLHIYPPYPAMGRLYEDDGCTRAYQQGSYCLTEVMASERAGKVLVEVKPGQGTYAGSGFERQVQVVLHQAKAPKGLMVENGKLLDWVYDPATAELRVRTQNRSDVWVSIIVRND